MNQSLILSNNKMVCKFCNTTCIKANRERKRYWWWNCKTCNVNFLVSLKGDLEIIQFESKEEYDRFYTLHILINKIRTDICVWNKETKYIPYIKYKQQPDKPYYRQDLVTSFDQVLEITPANFEAKLKTYLLLL